MTGAGRVRYAGGTAPGRAAGGGLRRWTNAWIGLLAAAALAWAPPAHAEQYAVPILVDSEDDIFDLFDNGDISESEMDLLMELYQKKIDLNRASRDELYEFPGVTYPMVDAILELRAEKGGFEDLGELESAGAVPYLVMKQMEAFASFGRPKLQLDAPVHGSVRLKTLYQPMAAAPIDDVTVGFDGTDFDAGNVRRSPAIGLRSKITALGGRLDASWTILGRDLSGSLTASGTEFDPYFIARGPRFTVEPLRKQYALYRADVGTQGRGTAVIGNFNAGFGERLTFDTTNRRRPYGLYGDDLIFDAVGGLGNFNSDFRVHRGLQGVAGSLERLPVGGSVSMDVTGWLSSRAVDEYMYRFTPNRTYFDEDAALAGPDRCSTERRCHAYETFRNVYLQQVGGGNLRINAGTRSYVGVTAYAARNRFLAGDDFVDFAPSARQPIRRSFGALGVDAAVGAGIVDVFGEATVTDRGAVAAILRSVWDLDRVALEVTGRHYDVAFDNPFSRGEASPAQFLGLRGRNETGVKARAIGKPTRWWRFVGHADTWFHPAFGRQDVNLYLRNELTLTRDLRWAFWADTFDKDISVGGRDQDYIRTPSVDYDDIYFEDDPDAAAEDVLAAADDIARGVRHEAGTQLAWKATKQVQITGYGRLRWRDISTYDEFFERNGSAWLRVSVKPRKWFDVSTRVRYWSDDIDFEPEDRDGDGVLEYDRGNAFVEGYLRLAVSVPKTIRASVRYDLRTFTDVKERANDPQHLLRMTLEAFF